MLFAYETLFETLPEETQHEIITDLFENALQFIRGYRAQMDFYSEFIRQNTGEWLGSVIENYSPTWDFAENMLESYVINEDEEEEEE